MKYFITLIFSLFLMLAAKAQQFGINTTSPDALLQIQSSSQVNPTNKDGLLIPKMNNFPATNPSNGQDGMLIFITGNGIPNKGIYFWDNVNSVWKFLINRTNGEIPANNGLSLDSNTIQIGGDLMKDTNLNFGTYDFDFNLASSGEFNIASNAEPNLFNIDPTNDRVVIGASSGIGIFNVEGDSWFNGDVTVRDNVPNGNRLINMGANGSSGDGQLVIYDSDNVHHLLGTAVTYNSGNLVNADFRIKSQTNDNMFFMDSSLNKVCIGASTGDGVLNVNGNSLFSDNMTLREEVSSGDILVNIFDSNDDGAISIYSDNTPSHTIHGNSTTFFNLQNKTNADFYIRSANNDQMFSLDASDNKVSIGAFGGDGTFNVFGNSIFSDNITLRDGGVSSGDLLVNIYDSLDDGAIDINSDGSVSHRIHGNQPVEFNMQNKSIADFKIGSQFSDNTFFLNAGTGRVSIGTDEAFGTFNVDGQSYYSEDIYLRKDGISTGDLLVRLYDSSDDDGVIDVYSNNQINHRIWADGTTSFNLLNQSNVDFIVESVSTSRMLFVDSSANRVALNSFSADATLSVNGTASKTGGGSWSTFSDKRLKTNISSYKEGLDFISKVDLVSYQFNDKYFREFGDSPEIRGKVFQGVIAQDLQKIAPDMVTTVKLERSEVVKPEDDKSPKEYVGVDAEYLQVDPSKFTYALINSVKELNEKNQQLEEKVNALEARLQKIEELLSK